MMYYYKLEYLVVMGKLFLNGVISVFKLMVGNDF